MCNIMKYMQIIYYESRKKSKFLPSYFYAHQGISFFDLDPEDLKPKNFEYYGMSINPQNSFSFYSFLAYIAYIDYNPYGEIFFLEKFNAYSQAYPLTQSAYGKIQSFCKSKSKEILGFNYLNLYPGTYNCSGFVRYSFEKLKATEKSKGTNIHIKHKKSIFPVKYKTMQLLEVSKDSNNSFKFDDFKLAPIENFNTINWEDDDRLEISNRLAYENIPKLLSELEKLDGDCLKSYLKTWTGKFDNLKKFSNNSKDAYLSLFVEIAHEVRNQNNKESLNILERFLIKIFPTFSEKLLGKNKVILFRLNNQNNKICDFIEPTNKHGTSKK